ncbi:acyl-CoA thioesterase [Streptomyces fuscichromogenes]|uniref:Acyl-CoA thioesterase II n=1 Tax=Streptomyces fuscichromogenes TaxID=1324013 RepID=A0A917X9P1_9ACTN|nr:acyl-CoA thioesterase domain-containing protein [Streptomyces fuscichromogenes]GGM97892.1 acyl-CoA thioesterase II [Streptomyces fuscichromogenes]
MPFTIEAFLDALDLKEVGTDRYTAGNIDTGHFVVFGGQLLAQSIAAARFAEQGKSVKTLHTVFARAGSPAEPMQISVERLHSGRSLASCTVTISQGEQVCTRSMVLLSADEPDFIRHGDRLTDAGPPAAASRRREDNGEWEVRIVDGADIDDPLAVGPARLGVWTRFPNAPDDPATAQALLAYATDGFLIGTAMRPHRGVGQSLAHRTISSGVLSHTITFHEPFSAADWLLLSHSSPYAGRGRSYGRADVFAEDGRLLASFVQDNMIRAMPKGATGL